ncbi:PH domain-containing protein [Amycolatopsis sp. GM8]|uniref:PH domain-containing protein n=1 Tax=Amycolatopsis sp. GM8 TaxID=2896530 RepID=UPI001F179490|nr:PH domain-containing protein [Amycolatopsis sp. GM8]
MSEYRDRWIECTADEIRIRGYYFPWGTKRIPYRSIRSVRRVEMDALTGRGRIWGTASPRYWAGFDPGRPRKKTALILDLGRTVRPS